MSLSDELLAVYLKLCFFKVTVQGGLFIYLYLVQRGPDSG